MLNGTLTLHDIRDTEAFCNRILQRKGLTGKDHEELLAFLIEETWILSTRDPQPWTRSFSGWVTPLLHLRLIDHVRQAQGDHRYDTGRHKHEHISLDDDSHRLADDQPTTQRDHPPDRNADQLVRLLRTRSSDEAWRHHQRRARLSNRAA